MLVYVFKLCILIFFLMFDVKFVFFVNEKFEYNDVKENYFFWL